MLGRLGVASLRSLATHVSRRGIALRRVTLDLHAHGEAEGLPGSSIDLVLPQDWRDVPHAPHSPPFWVLPWPSGSALAAHLLKEPSLVAGKKVIDIGCGVAPAGIAAALAGAAHVELTDKDEHALQCAHQGAQANAVDHICSTRLLDWLEAEEEEEEDMPRADVLLACDVFFSESLKPALVRLLPRLLRPGGTLLLGLPVESEYRDALSSDPHRAASDCLRTLCKTAGFSAVRVFEMRGAQLMGEGPEGLAAARRVWCAELQLVGVGNNRSSSSSDAAPDADLESVIARLR